MALAFAPNGLLSKSFTKTITESEDASDVTMFDSVPLLIPNGLLGATGRTEGTESASSVSFPNTPSTQSLEGEGDTVPQFGFSSLLTKAGAKTRRVDDTVVDGEVLRVDEGMGLSLGV